MPTLPPCLHGAVAWLRPGSSTAPACLQHGVVIMAAAVGNPRLGGGEQKPHRQGKARLAGHRRPPPIAREPLSNKLGANLSRRSWAYVIRKPHQTTPRREQPRALPPGRGGGAAPRRARPGRRATVAPWRVGNPNPSARACCAGWPTVDFAGAPLRRPGESGRAAGGLAL